MFYLDCHFFAHKVEMLVGDAVKQGAKVLTGGQRHASGPLFYEPTLIRDVTPTMMVASEEVFGPVASIIKQVLQIICTCIMYFWYMYM